MAEVEIKPYSPDQAEAVLAFASSVPPEDRNFLKEDASDPAVVREWASSSSDKRYLAWSGGAVVGYVGLHPLSGWCDHVAEMRVLVESRSRGLGVGQRLVRRAIATAVDIGIAKIVTEVIADHDHTLGMLQANGFVPEALLADHVRDRQGELRDLMLLSCRTDELLGDLAMSGIADAVAPL